MVTTSALATDDCNGHRLDQATLGGENLRYHIKGYIGEMNTYVHTTTVTLIIKALFQQQNLI
mgnify:CR=1 FL=1